jgi:hypothetical protein
MVSIRLIVFAVISSLFLALPAQADPYYSSTIVRVDGVATGATQLGTVNVSYLPTGTAIAYVKADNSRWDLVPNTGSPANGTTVVDASDGRQWLKEGNGGGGGAAAIHATTHEAGGSDPIPLDLLAAPSDVITLNASTSAHGLAPKRSGSATDCLLGTGTYAACLSGISVGAGTILGNNGGSSGAPLALTPAQAKALLQVGSADIVDSPAFGQSLVKAGSAGAALTLLGTGSAALQPTSAFDAAGAAAAVQAASQPLSALLTAFAAQTPLSDRLTYWTGSGTLALATYTAAARTWDAAADVAAETALLNVVDATHKGLAPAGGGSTSTFLNANGAYSSPLTATGITAGSYGDSSHVAVCTFGADGRASACTPTAIAIANTAVSGLGTLSTQSGTFSGTSSGTNTGDQTLSGLGGVAKAGDSMTGPLATSKDYRYGSSAGQPSASLGGAAQVMVDWTAGAVQEKVLSANLTGTPTFTAPATTPAYGFTTLSFRLKQAASGGPFTVAAWPANAKWPNGQVPVVPTTASAYIWITCKYDQTTYDCMSAGNGGGFQ